MKLKSLEKLLSFQCGGEQSVTLTLTGVADQPLPTGCIGILPNKGGCVISDLKRKLVGGSDEVTNFATSLGIAGLDFALVEPTVKWVYGAFSYIQSPYNWSKVTGTAGGHIECIIE